MMITVLGTPAPQGSKRFLGKTKQGRGIMIETSDKTTPWRSSVINSCTEWFREHTEGKRVPLTGAVVCRLIFSFQRPASVKPAKRPYPCVPPDLDKLMRSTMDGLKAGGAIGDDALVVEVTRLAKVYCGEDDEALEVPGAVVVLGNLVPLDQIGGRAPVLGG